MRNLLIIVAALTVLSACQKDNLSGENQLSEYSYKSNHFTTDLETRNDEHSITGRVWEDEDGDGLQDFSEPPLQNITLLLKDSTTRQTIADYITDESGE